MVIKDTNKTHSDNSTQSESDNLLPEQVAALELAKQRKEQQEKVDAMALEIASKRLKRHAKTWEELAKF